MTSVIQERARGNFIRIFGVHLNVVNPEVAMSLYMQISKCPQEPSYFPNAFLRLPVLNTTISIDVLLMAIRWLDASPLKPIATFKLSVCREFR